MKRIDIEIRTSKPSPTRCGIYGCGRTGTAIAYTLMKSGVCRDLVLADPDPRRALREAAALSGALPFCSHTDIYSGDEEELAECGVIVFALEGDADEETLSARLRKTVTKIIEFGAEPILLNATYPLERMTQVLHEASGLPHGRVFGVGCVTECVRLRKMLGRHLAVNSAAISSSSEQPNFSFAVRSVPGRMPQEPAVGAAQMRPMEALTSEQESAFAITRLRKLPQSELAFCP